MVVEGREDEFEELIERGLFTAKQVSTIRAEADRVVRTIEGGGAPFHDGWEDWRPDQDWPVPRLTGDWSDEGMAELPEEYLPEGSQG